MATSDPPRTGTVLDHKDLPYPDNPDALEELLSTLGEHVVGHGLDNAHDMGGPEKFAHLHVGTSLDIYVEALMDQIWSAGVFESTSVTDTPSAKLQQAAHWAFRDAITEAAEAYARESDITIYEPADSTDETPPLYVIGDTDIDALPYPSDRTSYRALLYLLARKSLNWSYSAAGEQGPATEALKEQYAGTQYHKHIPAVLYDIAPEEVPFTDPDTTSAPDHDQDNPVDAVKMATWAVLTDAIAQAAPAVDTTSAPTVYTPTE